MDLAQIHGGQLDIQYDDRTPIQNAVIIFLLVATSALLIIFVFKKITFLDITVLGLFASGGIFLLKRAQSQLTSIHKDGVITVTTTPYFGGKTITRTLNLTDYHSVEYRTGYRGGKQGLWYANNWATLTLVASTQSSLILVSKFSKKSPFSPDNQENFLSVERAAHIVADFTGLPLTVTDTLSKYL